MREMKRSIAALLFVVLVASGCSSGSTGNAQAPAQPATTPVSHAPASGGIANGKLIFQTGRDAAHMFIVAQQPPLHPTCAACHRPNGSGGLHLPGGAVSADLRYKALVTGQKTHPYTLELLERAISTGVDNNGEKLNFIMPRWKLSKTDLHDVAQYVLTQLK